MVGYIEKYIKLLRTNIQGDAYQDFDDSKDIYYSHSSEIHAKNWRVCIAHIRKNFDNDEIRISDVYCEEHFNEEFIPLRNNNADVA
jgi:hypothetical protein